MLASPETSTGLSTAFEDAVATASARVARIHRGEGRHRWSASGTVVGDDTVVVAAHSLERDDQIPVHLPDPSDPQHTLAPVAARLLGVDAHLDLAVLHVPGARLPVGTTEAFGSTARLRLGSLVLAVGRPGKARATVGVVTSLDGAWRTGGGSSVDAWIETELGGWPGFSGSPLVSADGTLLGVNTFGLVHRRSLVLPGSTVQRAVADIRAHGRVRRGWLGVGAQPVRLPAALVEARGQPSGLLVASIAPGSPAEQGGLLLGDVLLAYNEVPLLQVDDLVGALEPGQIGQSATFAVLRAGEVHAVALTVGGR